MSRVQPDIAPQIQMLNKFAKFLLPVFAEIGSRKATASSIDPNNQNQGVNANLDPLKVRVIYIYTPIKIKQTARDLRYINAFFIFILDTCAW